MRSKFNLFWMAFVIPWNRRSMDTRFKAGSPKYIHDYSWIMEFFYNQAQKTSRTPQFNSELHILSSIGILKSVRFGNTLITYFTIIVYLPGTIHEKCLEVAVGVNKNKLFPYVISICNVQDSSIAYMEICILATNCLWGTNFTTLSSIHDCSRGILS